MPYNKKHFRLPGISSAVSYAVQFSFSDIMNGGVVIIMIIIIMIQEIGRRITAVTENTRETVFLFQRLSIALQRGNAVAFLATFDAV